MNVVFTGPCQHFTRNTLEEMLNANDHILQKGVSKTTDVIVLENLNSNTVKAIKARKLGVRAILYDEFLKEFLPEFMI